METERGSALDDTAAFTIAEVAERTGLTAHTLRYYERAGLIQSPTRVWNGHRRYSERDVRFVVLLTKLRSTGMSIADMRRYADLCRVGPDSFDARRELLQERRAGVLKRIDELQADLRLIDKKIASYARPLVG